MTEPIVKKQAAPLNVPNGVKKAPERPKLKMVTESFDPKSLFRSNK